MRVFSKPKIQKVTCQQCGAIYKPSRKEVKENYLYGIRCPICGQKPQYITLINKDGKEYKIY